MLTKQELKPGMTIWYLVGNPNKRELNKDVIKTVSKSPDSLIKLRSGWSINIDQLDQTFPSAFAARVYVKLEGGEITKVIDCTKKKHYYPHY